MNKINNIYAEIKILNNKTERIKTNQDQKHKMGTNQDPKRRIQALDKLKEIEYIRNTKNRELNEIDPNINYNGIRHIDVFSSLIAEVWYRSCCLSNNKNDNNDEDMGKLLDDDDEDNIEDDKVTRNVHKNKYYTKYNDSKDIVIKALEIIEFNLECKTRLNEIYKKYNNDEFVKELLFNLHHKKILNLLK